MRGLAFNYLVNIPEYSRAVLNLIEEVEKDRQHISSLQLIRDDDSLIIKGLIENLALAEKVCYLVHAYILDEIEAEELNDALKAWIESRKLVPVQAETT